MDKATSLKALATAQGSLNNLDNLCNPDNLNIPMTDSCPGVNVEAQSPETSVATRPVNKPYTNLSAAAAVAKKNGKMLYIHIGRAGCFNCTQMRKMYPNIAEFKDFIMVDVDCNPINPINPNSPSQCINIICCIGVLICR